MTYYITADVRVQFRVEGDVLDRYIDDNTGVVGLSRVADALSVGLDGCEAHSVVVVDVFI